MSGRLRPIARPYLYTRVSLMSKRLLDAERARKVLDTPLEDLGPLLAELGAEALAAVPSDAVPRWLEQRRLAILLAEILILSRPLPRLHREFLLYWTHALELFNLKAILRGRLTAQSAASIRAELLDMGPFAVLPVDALVRAESAAEVLRLLEGTPFAELASQARRVLEQGRDLFFLDTTFDRRFYSGLAKRADALDNTDPESFRRLMAAIIDGTNLVWLARYRFVYRLPAPETYFLLIPVGYDLQPRHLKRLSALEDLESVIAAAPHPLASKLAGVDSIDELSRRVGVWRHDVAREVVRRSRSGFIRAFAYVLLRGQDLLALRGIVKAKQLGLPDELARAALYSSGTTVAEAAHV